jgi:hypothetical protein
MEKLLLDMQEGGSDSSTVLQKAMQYLDQFHQDMYAIACREIEALSAVRSEIAMDPPLVSAADQLCLIANCFFENKRNEEANLLFATASQFAAEVTTRRAMRLLGKYLYANLEGNAESILLEACLNAGQPYSMLLCDLVRWLIQARKLNRASRLSDELAKRFPNDEEINNQRTFVAKTRTLSDVSKFLLHENYVEKFSELIPDLWKETEAELISQNRWNFSSLASRLVILAHSLCMHGCHTEAGKVLYSVQARDLRVLQQSHICQLVGVVDELGFFKLANRMLKSAQEVDRSSRDPFARGGQQEKTPRSGPRSGDGSAPEDSWPSGEVAAVEMEVELLLIGEPRLRLFYQQEVSASHSRWMPCSVAAALRRRFSAAAA